MKFYTCVETNKGRSSIDYAGGGFEDGHITVTILEGRVKTEEVAGRKIICEITVKAKISTAITSGKTQMSSEV